MENSPIRVSVFIVASVILIYIYIYISVLRDYSDNEMNSSRALSHTVYIFAKSKDEFRKFAVFLSPTKSSSNFLIMCL